MDVFYHDDFNWVCHVTVPEGQLDSFVGRAGATHQRGGPGGAAGPRGHQLPVQPDGVAPGSRVRYSQSGHTDTTQNHSQVRAISVLQGILRELFAFG